MAERNNKGDKSCNLVFINVKHKFKRQTVLLALFYKAFI